MLNIHYVTQKFVDKTAAKKSVNLLQRNLTVADTTKSAIASALQSGFADIEDAVQHAIAFAYKCQFIITRNIKDYKKSSLPVMTAAQYLKAYHS
ncbi:hypothetical protein H8S90_03015 [Olivibacter sp. SDN3]|nr:PIN domain-containing protein [Olivibacter sp. SDN3]QNL50593.1 hypothetical protein H8S90_03015 [Olivibacter sp. SDN3]